MTDRDATMITRPQYGEPEPRIDAGRDFMSTLTTAVQENPVPAALIAIGAFWLFMGGNRVSVFGGERQGLLSRGAHLAGSAIQSGAHLAGSAVQLTGEAVGSSSGAVYDLASRAGSAVAGDIASAWDGLTNATADAAEGVAATTSALMSGVGKTASHGVEAVSSISNRVASSASQIAETVPAAASDLSRTVIGTGGHLSGAAQQSLSDLFERQPIALGAIGIAIGAAIAASLPITAVEQDTLGEASAGVSDTVRRTVTETVERAKSLANTAVEEAQKHGLTPDAMKGVVRDTADKVARLAGSASEAARTGLNEKFS